MKKWKICTSIRSRLKKPKQACFILIKIIITSFVINTNASGVKNVIRIIEGNKTRHFVIGTVLSYSQVNRGLAPHYCLYISYSITCHYITIYYSTWNIFTNHYCSYWREFLKPWPETPNTSCNKLCNILEVNNVLWSDDHHTIV